MNTRWLFYKDLNNTKVAETNAEKTGSLENAVVDLQTGHIAFYTLESGGFLGIGEDRIALPPDALQFDKDSVRLRVDAARLQDSPGSHKDWPERVDTNFINDLYRHYGFRPYTER